MVKHPKASIRFAYLSDLNEMQQLFVETIQSVCKPDYTRKQIEIWTSTIEKVNSWTHKIETQYFLIAELGNKMVGYASLDGNNYLDFLYVHKDYQRQGIAKRLYDEIEKEARNRGSKNLSADVSKTAKSFFEKMGFETVAKRANTIRGITLVNFKMKKELLPK